MRAAGRAASQGRWLVSQGYYIIYYIIPYHTTILYNIIIRIVLYHPIIRIILILVIINVIQAKGPQQGVSQVAGWPSGCACHRLYHIIAWYRTSYHITSHHITSYNQIISCHNIVIISFAYIVSYYLISYYPQKSHVPKAACW